MAPSPTSALTEIVSSAQSLLGFTRPSRLREQLRGTLDIYERTRAVPELTEATDDLGTVVTVLARRLRDAACPSTKRAWAFGPAVIVLIPAAICLIPDIWLAGALDQWWAVLLTAICAAPALFFVAVAFKLLFERQPIPPEVIAAPPTGTPTADAGRLVVDDALPAEQGAAGSSR